MATVCAITTEDLDHLEPTCCPAGPDRRDRTGGPDRRTGGPGGPGGVAGQGEGVDGRLARAWVENGPGCGRGCHNWRHSSDDYPSLPVATSCMLETSSRYAAGQQAAQAAPKKKSMTSRQQSAEQWPAGSRLAAGNQQAAAAAARSDHQQAAARCTLYLRCTLYSRAVSVSRGML